MVYVCVRVCLCVGHSSGIVGMFAPHAVLPLCCLTAKILIASRCKRVKERERETMRRIAKGGKWHKVEKCEIKRDRDILLLLASLKPNPENSRETHKSPALVLQTKVNLLQGDYLKWAGMSPVSLFEFITWATWSCGLCQSSGSC